MRIIELLEGDNSKLSSRTLCTYVVVLTLCISIIVEMGQPSAESEIVLGLAGILSTMMTIIWGVGKAVDGSVMKAVEKKEL